MEFHPVEILDLMLLFFLGFKNFILLKTHKTKICLIVVKVDFLLNIL